MKKRISPFLAVLLSFVMFTAPPAALLTLGTGCASVAEGESPIVVNAERVAAGSFDIIDSFLQYEAANRDLLWRTDPGIKRVADQLRDQAPVAIETLRSATKAYKRNRTPENEANLKTWLATVNSLLASATSNMAKAVRK